MEGQREATPSRLGLISDPDFPELVADNLARVLPEHLSDPQGWVVEVEVDPITAGKHSTAEILRAVRRRREQRGWDYAICVTDLPVRLDHRPVLADANVEQRVAVVSLPALGGAQPQRRAKQVILQLLDELTGPTGHPARNGNTGRRRGLRSPLTDLLAPIRRETVTEDGEVDIRYRATRTRGRLRLLTGMVRTNRPWRLVFGLSSALAAALATSAYALSSSTVWQIGDELGPARHLGIAMASVVLLVVWLITAHHLWETRRRNSARDREQVMFYNASTVLTLGIGVVCMYLGLFVLSFGIATFLISTELLARNLGHPVGWGSYFTLAWGVTTMGVIAGALGSSLETDADVRRAAYGYREEQRRAQQQHDPDNE